MLMLASLHFLVSEALGRPSTQFLSQFIFSHSLEIISNSTLFAGLLAGLDELVLFYYTDFWINILEAPFSSGSFTFQVDGFGNLMDRPMMNQPVISLFKMNISLVNSHNNTSWSFFTNHSIHAFDKEPRLSSFASLIKSEYLPHLQTVWQLLPTVHQNNLSYFIPGYQCMILCTPFSSHMCNMHYTYFLFHSANSILYLFHIFFFPSSCSPSCYRTLLIQSLPVFPIPFTSFDWFILALLCLWLCTCISIGFLCRSLYRWLTTNNQKYSSIFHFFNATLGDQRRPLRFIKCSV